VTFKSPVSGLLVGSGVLFNGIRVGEVTELALSAADPTQVQATIAVDPATPVRADTKVGIDFQGLTGAPVILLSGGSAAAPALAAGGDAMPTLAAEPDAGQSLTQTARATLQRFDGILAENAEAVRATMANLKTFSDALARNSDRVDNVVAGLERMTGGAVARGKVAIYALNAVRDFPPAGAPRGQLLVPEPNALMALSSDKILIARDGNVGAGIDNVLWADNLPVLVQAKVIESLDSSHYFQAVSRQAEGFEPDFQLLIELRTFGVTTGPKPAADVTFSAKILSGSRIVASHVFEASVPLAATDAAAATVGLNAAFADTVRALVLWTKESLAAVPLARSAEDPAPATEWDPSPRPEPAPVAPAPGPATPALPE
jgi:phospholipid/cholesterol/gamma-HCH transport system substrate-binding protein